MALFNRNRNSVLPEEVREYYQAEGRPRTVVAWLLAIATLVVTLLVAAALFFGGRWAYRALFNKNDKPATTQTTQSSAEDTASTSANPATTGSAGAGQTSSTSTTTPATTQPTPTTTPNTGPTELINTGPGDESGL